MKFNDTVSGIFVLGLGLAIVLVARSFPSIPGQAIGPALFPIIIGCGLMLFGGTLVAAAWRAPRAPLVVFDDWVRRPRMVANFLIVPADLLFYALVVDQLGFLLTSAVFLGVLFLAFRVRLQWVAPLAVLVALAMHLAFYSLLRVPLPWGVLEGIAW
jgi:putative tricarboxylic transport membrane protein